MERPTGQITINTGGIKMKNRGKVGNNSVAKMEHNG